VLLASAVPWPSDGILCWLRLLIADHIPAPNVGDLPLVVSAFPQALVLLALIFSLVITVLHQRCSSLSNKTIEMTFSNSSIQLATVTGCKPLGNGTAETCSPNGDATSLPMDVDVEEEEKDQASVESSMERAVGLPFPSALLADGTFAVEYHNM
jgi:hypothetical protein